MKLHTNTIFKTAIIFLVAVTILYFWKWYCIAGKLNVIFFFINVVFLQQVLYLVQMRHFTGRLRGPHQALYLKEL